MADTMWRDGSGLELNDLEPEVEAPAVSDRPWSKEIDKILRQTYSVPGEDYPRGYPRLAAFQSSEPNWSIYRAFGYLHSRVILQLQDELRELEDDLNSLDYDHAHSNDPTENSRVTSRQDDHHAAQREHESQQGAGRVVLSDRAILLAKIEDRLVRYDKILINAREMVEFQKPNDRDWLSLRTWFWNRKPLSWEREELFVHMKDDLVTLKPRDDSGRLDTWIDQAVTHLPRCMGAFFASSGPKKFNDPQIVFTHTGRIEKLAILVVVLIIIFLLATPVFIMYRITWNNTRSSTFLNIGLLIVFSLLFAASMGLLTKAKRAELFAATAAYCAVLIVFIGNFSGNAT